MIIETSLENMQELFE